MSISLVWDLVSPSSDFCGEESQIWEKWAALTQRMVNSCVEIWRAVEDVLCNDSPEGHLPQEIDDVDAIDTKDVLSYSFRAVHESR